MYFLFVFLTDLIYKDDYPSLQGGPSSLIKELSKNYEKTDVVVSFSDQQKEKEELASVKEDDLRECGVCDGE